MRAGIQRLALCASLGLAGSLGLTGCPKNGAGPDAGQETELPFAGQSITIAAPAGLGFPLQWEGPLREWQAQTGARAELLEYDPRGPSQPAGQFSESGGRTLVIFPLDRLGDLLAAEALAPIPSAARDDASGVHWIDLFAGLRDGLASPRKRPSLVPLSCPVLVCYYRRDLLEQAGHSPPKTWDDYQKLLEGLETWAPGLRAVEPWGAAFRGTMFLARSLSYAKHPGQYSLFFDIDTGAPLINGPGFVRGLEVSERAWKRLDPDFRILGPAECRQRVLSGQAAMAIGLEPETVPESTPAVATAPVPIGVCRLPGSRESYNPSRRSWEAAPDRSVNQVTLVGFAGLACGASAARGAAEIEAAWNAVSQIGPQGFVSGFPPGTIGLCRESQAASGLGTAGAGLPGDAAAMYRDAIAQSLRDTRQVAELPVVRHGDFLAALSVALEPALDGSAGPERALKVAAESWQRLVDEIGAARLRNNYRAALGLSPVASGK